MRMTLAQIGAAFIGIMVVRALRRAWTTRHDLQTGDPTRWDRIFDGDYRDDPRRGGRQ